eukprot:SAG11_NODE_1386_length_5067_cov_1.750403_1_plen_59_part_00
MRTGQLKRCAIHRLDVGGDEAEDDRKTRTQLGERADVPVRSELPPPAWHRLMGAGVRL